MTDNRRKRLLDSLLLAIVIAWLLGMIMYAAGCTRTIYVPHGEPVRLRETVPNAKVWVLDADGEPVAGRMDLPEGWYALPYTAD